MPINLEIYEIMSGKILSESARVLEDEESGNFIIESRLISADLYVESEWAFTALQEYRKVLRPKEMDINCYGALSNVYPSPMMMNSTKAYYLKMHEPATMKSVVEIFDYFKVDESSSVDSQDDFYQEWIASL